MKKLNILIIGIVITLTSCGLSTNSSKNDSLITECQIKAQEKYGQNNNFVVKSTASEKLAEDVKLAMGEYRGIAKFHVSIEFSNDSISSGYCSCLFDENKKFLVTMDEINH